MQTAVEMLEQALHLPPQQLSKEVNNIEQARDTLAQMIADGFLAEP